ncbi:murein hydrolase activator EnvC [Microbacterium sp. W4I20]|uniref:murein hydrolase activator EnvC family protein n=1 Tax=Microbacterium sp. W4I20 TaxID=3042262 RepID=UPI002782C3D8|nr:peptidoglycan DD-metalloendopeptidase family protein [Microbacterium sp. W4I20]MDQ0725584.1 murein DD-endopeptidase MepM/ murein hydrolase activator NlpD [Microbacterium sp. W4I20]
MRLASRTALIVLVLVLLSVSIGRSASAADSDAEGTWLWPLDGARRIAEPFRAPAHEYGAGHRGVDLVASPAAVVRAPADGVVAFRGTVVDRALLTIEHEGGFVSTFEPVTSTLDPGDAVSAGDEIGVLAVGGHAAAGTLHVGVRLEGDYINPMLMFGSVPRSVLLPCCDAL